MPRAIRKILYCADLTETANQVFGYAVLTARLTGAEIHILHTVEKLSPEAHLALQTYLPDVDSFKQAMARRRQQAKQLLEKNLEAFWQAQDETVRAVRQQVVSVDVRQGYPGQEALKRAEELQCDLIVMGAHAKGLTHSYVGGVTKSVLNHSTIPTLVVPVAEY